MNILEAIQRVDKSDTNEKFADYSDFCEELGILDYSGWNEKFNEMVRGYFLMKWHCTDQWVGFAVYFLDDEPIAVGYKPARKSDEKYTFVSEKAIEKIREFIFSIMEKSQSTEIELLKDDDEIEDFYNVHYTGQLLTKEGYVNGKHCKIVNEFKENYISQEAIVEYDDGSLGRINISDFKIPICIK